MNADLALVIAIARFLPRYLFVLFFQILTFPLAPLLCLFVVYCEESATTGYPSQFPGKPRAFLSPPIRLFQTFDDCLDAYWYSGRAAWMGFDQTYYDSHWWLRWACNVLWLWRNPAYGFARLAGYDQDGMHPLYEHDEDATWDTGQPSRSLWVVRNGRGQCGFLFQWQWYFWRQHCLEVVLGWKVPWDGDPRNRAMLAARISPFKQYPI